MTSRLPLLKGSYHDQIITAQGQALDLGWHSNIIVDRCRYLLAAFMKGDRAMGIRLLAVGKGIKSWDIQPPSPPLKTRQRLIDPNPFKIVIKRSQIKYLDPTGNPTNSPTNRIQIIVTIKPGVPPIEGEGDTYPLREFGLFGRFMNKDYMIDYIRHPVIHKQADDKLVRTIRLIF